MEPGAIALCHGDTSPAVCHQGPGSQCWGLTERQRLPTYPAPSQTHRGRCFAGCPSRGHRVRCLPALSSPPAVPSVRMRREQQRCGTAGRVAACEPSGCRSARRCKPGRPARARLFCHSTRSGFLRQNRECFFAFVTQTIASALPRSYPM